MAARPRQCFIVIKQPQYPAHMKPGSICYSHTYTPLTKRTRQPKKVSVYVVDALSALSYDLEVDLLRELSVDEAELLQAVASKAERLKWLTDRHALQAAQQLAVDTAVTVYSDGEKVQGIIRFIGCLTEPTFSSPLSGRFFGIELQVGFTCVFLKFLNVLVSVGAVSTPTLLCHNNDSFERVSLQLSAFRFLVS